MSSWQDYKKKHSSSQNNSSQNNISSWERYKKEQEERVKQEEIKKAEEEKKKQEAKQKAEKEMKNITSGPSTTNLKTSHKQSFEERKNNNASNQTKNTNTNQKNSKKNVLDNITNEPIYSTETLKKQSVDGKLYNENQENFKTNINNAFNDTSAVIKNILLGTKQGLMNFAESGVSAVDKNQVDMFNMQTKILGNTNRLREQKGLNSLQFNEYEKKKTFIDEEKQEKWLNEKNKITKQIISNTEDVKNPIIKKLSGIAPTIGQQIPGYLLPSGTGLVYFTGSAKGAYMEDAKSRGMDDEETNVYSGIMALTEGLAEQIGAGFTKKVGKSIIKGNSKTALKAFGLDVAENFLEESVMEPISEAAATMTAGKEKSNWNDIGKRMLNSGLDGALTSIITAGASAGIGKAIQVTNKINNNQPVTSQEISEAVTTTLQDKNIDTSQLKNKIINNTNKIISQNKNEVLNSNMRSNNFDNQQTILNSMKTAQNQNMSQTKQNDIKLPVRELSYVESARKYNIDTNNETVQSIARVTNERNLKASYNSDLFTNNNQNAVWRVNTDEKGNTTREVVLNPNADTNKTLQNVIVHELTHDMEGTKQYNELKDLILKYDKTKIGYEDARKNLEEIYSKVYDANSNEFKTLIDNEAVADILGNKLGDQDFINNLTKENRTVGQKIYDWVVDKLNKLNAKIGYKSEKLYWADVKNKFENAFKQEYQNNNDNTTKFDIITDGNKKYVKATRQVIKGNNPLEWEKQVQNYINETIRNGKDVQVFTDDGDVLSITENTSGKAKFRNEIIDKNGNKRRLNNKEFMAKLRAETHIDEIGEVSKHKQGPVPDTKNHPFAKDGFTYRTAYFEDINGEYYKLTMSVGKNGDINTIYNIGKMQKSQKNRRHSISELKGSSGKTTSDRISSINSIPPTKSGVNTTNKYSMQESENNTVLSENAKKQLHRYSHMNIKELNKAFSEVLDNKENMLDEANRLRKEYKDFQNSEEFKLALEDFAHKDNVSEKVKEIMNKAQEYADKIRYYNNAYETYQAQQEAINSLIMGNSSNIRNTQEIVDEAEEHFGITNNYNETAYIDINGNQIDFSGKHDGGPSGSRNLDHRQINEINIDMNSFIEIGNIRILPESGGINLKIEPNIKQYDKLREYINSINGEIYIDIDKANNTYDSAEYKKGTPTSKIINDLKYYFENGNFPKQSELAQFRYSLSKNKTWQRYLETNYKNTGKGETIKQVKLPPAKQVENKSNSSKIVPPIENKKQSNLDLYNKYKKNIIKDKETAINTLIQYKNETTTNLDKVIAEKQSLLESKTNKDTKTASILKSQIESLKSRKTEIENLYNEKIDKFNSKISKEKIELETRNAMKKIARDNLNAEISPLVEDLTKYKDKKAGILFNRETAQRNIDDIVSNKDLAKAIKETIFDPVQVHQAQKTREINRLYEKINSLNLDKTKKYYYIPEKEIKGIMIDEATLAQLVIEKKINDTDLRNYGLNDKGIKKIHNAADTFSEILDDLYNRMNEEQIKYGYSPIGKIKNYFPHFIENKADTMLGKLASRFGIDLSNQNLPTEIAGKTDTFKPGKTWNSNTQKRRTNKTDYDALVAMEKYIQGATDIIYTTEDIQRVREYSRQIRYKFSDKGIQDEIDKITNNNELTQEAKDLALEGIFKNTENELSNFVTWLDDYANTLANKKSFADRNMERNIGRNMYNSMSGIESRIAANTIGGNLSVSFTNFAPIFQAAGTTKWNYLVTGMLQTTSNDIKDMVGNKDVSFIDNSNFLTNRFGTDSISQKKTSQKISNFLSMPMESIDKFTSESIVRAKYLENIDKGMSEDVALDNADKYAAKIMADRSKGALPIVFNTKNPISKLLTMFQVEPNNIVSNYLKDMPRDASNKATLTAQATKLMVASYAFNSLIMAVRGGNEVLPDPIRWVSYLIKAITGDDEEKEKAKTDLSESVLGSMPFVSNLAGFIGLEDIGRIPISNAMPDLSVIGKLVDSEADGKYKSEAFWKEVSKPLLYLGLPVGGAQLKKTIEGISTVANGGSYKTNKEGEKELQFAVENPNVGDYIKAGVFGKYSLAESKLYADRGYKSLSSKQTKIYEESGLPYKEYLEYLDQKLTKKEDKLNYLNSKNWTSNQKWGIYKNDILSNTKRKEDGGSQRSDAEYMISHGVSKSEFIKLYNNAQKNDIDIPTKDEYKEMKNSGLSLKEYIDYSTKVKEETKVKRKEGELTENQSLKDKDKIQILLDSDYTDEQKTVIYEKYILSKTNTTYPLIKQTGIDINEYMKYTQQEFESDTIDDGTTTGKTVSGSSKRKVYDYVNNMNITYEQRLMLLGLRYTLSNNEQTNLYNYVCSLNYTQREQKKIFEKLKGFTVYNDGRITW